MKYIGVKIVDAVPMTSEEFNKHIGRSARPEDKTGDGYIITYPPDNYQGWCPKSVFEAANFPLTDPSGSKICIEDVELMRGPLSLKKLLDKTTLAYVEYSLTGFETFATSSCVDPANYDMRIGMNLAGEKINDEFWKCLGFVLQWAKNGLKWE